MGTVMQLALVFAVCAIAVAHLDLPRGVGRALAGLLVFCALLVALVNQAAR